MPRTSAELHRPTVYLLKHLSTALRLAMDDALAPTGMTAAQVAVLSVLHSKPGLSNAELARLAFVQPQSMVPLLKTLEARGLVVRQAHPAGGRSMPAKLTSKGAEHLRVGWSAAKVVEERMLSELTKTERSQFCAALESCLASLASQA